MGEKNQLFEVTVEVYSIKEDKETRTAVWFYVCKNLITAAKAAEKSAAECDLGHIMEVVNVKCVSDSVEVIEEAS